MNESSTVSTLKDRIVKHLIPLPFKCFWIISPIPYILLIDKMSLSKLPFHYSEDGRLVLSLS